MTRAAIQPAPVGVASSPAPTGGAGIFDTVTRDTLWEIVDSAYHAGGVDGDGWADRVARAALQLAHAAHLREMATGLVHERERAAVRDVADCACHLAAREHEERERAEDEVERRRPR
jgi:hypothetical protein